MLGFKFIGHNDDLYFNSDENIKGINEYVYTKEDEDGILFVRKTTNDKVFSYGFQSKKPHYDQGAGYIWASRVGCLNLEFGTDFVDVVINSCSFCMSAKDILEILPEGCYFERYEMFDDKEPNYRLRGYKDIQWFASHNGINMFTTTMPIQATGEVVLVDGDVELISTNYEGVYMFDTPEVFTDREIGGQFFYRREMKPSKFNKMSTDTKSKFIEVFVDRHYGYCMSKDFIKKKFVNEYWHY